MIEMLLPFLLVYVVFIGALVSPGPDLLIVMRNALGRSARAGVLTALGIAAGLVVHMAYCVAGIGMLIAQSALLFNLVKWLGAGYLVYIGVQALRSPGISEATLAGTMAHHCDRRAFAAGFITNVFNPKATMFFLALFSQMIDPGMKLSVTLVFCGLCIVTAALWFSAVALAMASPPARALYIRASKGIDRVFGGFFIALAVKLALTKAG